MNRHLVYPGQIPLETDLLNVAKDAYVGQAKLAEASRVQLATASRVP